MNTKPWIRWGFIGAGLSNIIGILFFSLFFTNSYIFEVFPQVMSPFGMLIIMVWGLVWIAMAPYYKEVRPLVGVFVLEKPCYVLSWGYWALFEESHSLSVIWEHSLLAAIFFAMYGLHDFLWGCFFAWVFLQAIPTKSAEKAV